MDQELIWLFWLAIVVPLSVDQYLGVHWGDYDIRGQYFGAALAFVVFTLNLFRDRSACTDLKNYLRSKFVLAFSVMGLAGAAGLLHSAHPKRSVFFLIWSMGTILGIPWMMLEFAKRIGKWIPRTLMLYALIQGILVLVDAMLCMPTAGRYHIGRVTIYEQLGAAPLCRPHAWYQEPGYFCAFALLAAIMARLQLLREGSNRWRKLFGISYVLLMAAMVVSTSRLGWLGVLVLMSIEAASALKRRNEILFANVRRWIPRALVILTIMGGIVFSAGNVIYDHVGRGVLNPSKDGSFVLRYRRAAAALQVFRDHPWTGAGPGAAGAYFVDNYPDAYLLTRYSAEEVQKMRSDPLSMNLYSELLSEWGILGTIAFFAGLFFLFRNAEPKLKICVWAMLSVIYTATQTLPRFDLWLMISVLWLMSQNRISPVEGTGNGQA